MISNKHSVLFIILITALGLICFSCGSSGDDSVTGSTIAGYTVATDSVLRTIPSSILNTIRSDFEVAYFHTSHGTHVSYGVYGLPGFKAGDDVKFAVSTSKEDGKLYFRDNPGGFSTPDLSQTDPNWDAWVDESRSWLEEPANAGVTVFMWSWCDIYNHDVSAYCAAMRTLINEYGPGGTRIGSGRARENPVNFVFMTGHANGGSNVGDGCPKNQADIINTFCRTNGYYCIDYYSIDTHAMNGTYYEDTNDDSDSAEYGGNFYGDWQDDHALGTDWYENRSSPEGSVVYGQHNTQHITANRKAFAFWWVMAKLAGWDGN